MFMPFPSKDDEGSDEDAEEADLDELQELLAA